MSNPTEHETQSESLALPSSAEGDSSPGGPQWLTLSEASEFLGIHHTTLRTWADKGEISVFRTPGGHRRFDLNDLRRFLARRQSTALVSNMEGLVEAAVVHVRQEMERTSDAQRPWSHSHNTDVTSARQQRGRQLFSLAIAFVLKPRRRAHLLAEGQKLGYEYGAEAAHSGLSLAETGRAVQFFRQQLADALHHEEVTDADDVRIQGLVNQFLDEVLYAVLDGYERALLDGLPSNAEPKA